MVENWCDDLTLGLPTSMHTSETYIRDPPCDCNDVVLEWSGDTFMNAAFPVTKKTFERIITIDNRSGPRVLWGMVSMWKRTRQESHASRATNFSFCHQGYRC